MVASTRFSVLGDNFVFPKRNSQRFVHAASVLSHFSSCSRCFSFLPYIVRFAEFCDVRMQLKHHIPLDYFGIHQGSYSKAIGWTRALVSRKRTASEIYKQPGKRRSGKHRFMRWWLSYRKSWSPSATTERCLNSVSQKDFFHFEEDEMESEIGLKQPCAYNPQNSFQSHAPCQLC